MTFQTAPYSTLVRTITFAVIVGLVGVPAFVLPFTGTPLAITIAAGGFGVAVLALTWGYAPQAYLLSREGLCIVRLLGRKLVPLAQVSGGHADPEAMRTSLRLFGSGGLFGFFGKFRNKKLGTYDAWVTNPDKSVVLLGGDKPLVVSPADPAAFLRGLDEVIGADA